MPRWLGAVTLGLAVGEFALVLALGPTRRGHEHRVAAAPSAAWLLDARALLRALEHARVRGWPRDEGDRHNARQRLDRRSVVRRRARGARLPGGISSPDASDPPRRGERGARSRRVAEVREPAADRGVQGARRPQPDRARSDGEVGRHRCVDRQSRPVARVRGRRVRRPGDDRRAEEREPAEARGDARERRDHRRARERLRRRARRVRAARGGQTARATCIRGTSRFSSPASAPPRSRS